MIILLAVLACSLPSTNLKAQVFEHAGQYIDYISKASEELTVTYLSYVSAVAHGKSARKVEKRRNEVLDMIYNTRTKIAGMSPWKGDRTYKDTTVQYLKMLDIIFREDYGKIVNMEEIAEQSYDAMEAYLLAQEKAEEKLEEARRKQNENTRNFAKKYDINLIEGESETGRKSETVAQVTEHHNRCYLIFFKPFKQEAYLLVATEGKGNLVALEQSISSLEKFAQEGLEKLKEVPPYQGDASLLQATREALNFYRSEARDAKGFTEFFLKNEKWEKTKKAFDSKRQSERTQKDIDDYNAGVKEINEAVKDYNELHKKLNKDRTDVLNAWNKAASKFMDEHTPVQRKVSK